MIMYRVTQGSARDRVIGIRVSFSRLGISFGGPIYIGPCNAVAAQWSSCLSILTFTQDKLQDQPFVYELIKRVLHCTRDTCFNPLVRISCPSSDRLQKCGARRQVPAKGQAN